MSELCSKRRKGAAAVLVAIGSLIALIPAWNDRLFPNKPFECWPCAVQWVLAIIAFLCAAAAIIIYLYELDSRSKMRKAQIDERLSNNTFLALQDANCNKTNEIMRYTYGQVHKWSHINYYANALMYDIHDQIRHILNSLRDLIINYDIAGRFNKDNVVVDLIYSYEDFWFGELSDPDIKDSIRLISSGDNDCGPVIKDLLYDNDSDTFYKLLIDGIDNKARDEAVNDSSKESETKDKKLKGRSYSYDKSEGYLFFHNKTRKVFNLPKAYCPTTKDKIYSNIANGGLRKDQNDYEVKGSIIGLVFYVKNDQPNQVGIKAVLTINTYGHAIVEGNKKEISEFEEGFYNKVLCSYRSLLVSELSQMYIRHQIKQGVRNPFTGEVLQSLEDMQDAVNKLREKYEAATIKSDKDVLKKLWIDTRVIRSEAIKTMSEEAEKALTLFGEEYRNVIEKNEGTLSKAVSNAKERQDLTGAHIDAN